MQITFNNPYSLLRNTLDYYAKTFVSLCGAYPTCININYELKSNSYFSRYGNLFSYNVCISNITLKELYKVMAVDQNCVPVFCFMKKGKLQVNYSHKNKSTKIETESRNEVFEDKIVYYAQFFLSYPSQMWMRTLSHCKTKVIFKLFFFMQGPSCFFSPSGKIPQFDVTYMS